MLNREPMWLKSRRRGDWTIYRKVSVLNREPMWLKCRQHTTLRQKNSVSVLNREPMWLKFGAGFGVGPVGSPFQCSTVSRCG